MNLGNIRKFGRNAAIGMAGMACISALHKPQNDIATTCGIKNDIINEYTDNNGNFKVEMVC